MPRRVMTAIATSTALLTAAPASADGMAEMVAKLPPPAFSSQKSSLALEYCIGLAVSDWLAVGTLHGEGRTLIAGNVSFGGLVAFLIAIDDLGSRRAVGFHTNKGWDDRVEGAIRSCL